MLLNRVSTKDCRGDTIVEVIIATAMIGLALVAGYAFTSHSLRTGIASGQRSEALYLAQGQIEFIKNSAITNPKTTDLYTNQTAAFCISNSTSPPPGTPVAAPSDVVNGTTTSPSAPANICRNYGGSPYNLYIKYNPSSGIFTIVANWQSLVDNGQDSLNLYYKLPGTSISVLPAPSPNPGPNPAPGPSPGPPSGSSVMAHFIVMTNPDIVPPPPAQQGPRLIVRVNGIQMWDRVYPPGPTPCPPSNNGSGANSKIMSTPAPTSFSTFADSNERCDDLPIPIDFSLFGGSISEISFEFVSGDYNGFRTGHQGDENYYMDSNFIISSVTVPGKTVRFRDYPGNPLGGPNLPPAVPAGATLPSHTLWFNWTGMAYFDVS